MASTITIKKPFDSHVHLRRGAVLRAVTKYTARTFAKAIVMPNTDPPIDTLAAAIEYKKEILAAPEVGSFEPLMTLYLTKNLTPQEIERGAVGAEGTQIYGVKYYPYGATTNSQWGYEDILAAKDILKEMERAGIPLLLHGEVHVNEHGEEEDPYDGEKLFIQDVLPRLLENYPKLKISLEHMSTRVACDFIEKNGEVGRLVATVTPTHLMYDRTQAFAGGYHTLYHMKPLVKRTADKERVRELATKGLPFISAGSDSAPHPETKKFSSCCVFGAFNSPIALELYAQVFDEMDALDSFENFISVNGPRFYGVETSEETLTLEKKEWQPADPVVADDGTKLWTVVGGGKVQWQIKSRS
jgi:dihydroorotase